MYILLQILDKTFTTEGLGKDKMAQKHRDKRIKFQNLFLYYSFFVSSASLYTSSLVWSIISRDSNWPDWVSNFSRPIEPSAPIYKIP